MAALLLLLLTLLPAAAGSLEEYRAQAQEQSPAVQAAFQRWQAAEAEITMARTLPEPMLDLGLMLRGGQLRVGLSQGLPWPGGLRAAGEAATAQARSAQRAFEAQAVEVAAGVEQAYWELWELRAAQVVLDQHLVVLDGLSQSTRAAMTVGGASLAEVQQVDLAAARVRDARATLGSRERAAEAELRAVLGRRDRLPLSTDLERPPLALPVEDLAAMEAAALANPRLGVLTELLAAAEARVRGARAMRAPEFSVEVAYGLTAWPTESSHLSAEADGLMLGLGIGLPLWQRSYARGIDAARAEAEMTRSEQRAMGDEALAQLEMALAELGDSERRVRLVDQELVPQAQATLDSLLGSWATGRASLAEVLMVQRELLELRLEADMAHAAHARAWAELRRVCGRDLPATPSVDGAG